VALRAANRSAALGTRRSTCRAILACRSGGARRRDFTVNAIAWDPLTGAYEDPFDGQADLNRHSCAPWIPPPSATTACAVLRADAVCRALRVPARRRHGGALPHHPARRPPAERVWGEIEKLLLHAARPSIGLALALDLGVVAALLPELVPLVGCQQEPEWHPEGDVWVHTLMVIDEATAQSRDLDKPRRTAVMLGAVCHDLGKPATTAFIDGRIRSLDHEQAGVEPTLRLLDRLNVHSIGGYDVRGQVVGLVAHHLKPGMFHKAANVGDGAFRRLAQKVDLELLARWPAPIARDARAPSTAARWTGSSSGRRALGVKPPAPLLLGRHVLALGVPAGPRVGEIVKAVYERQLDGEITTVDDATAAARALLNPRESLSTGGT
jgi:tRNA nucleotidyltransferase (CCA-adding enzyme)